MTSLSEENVEQIRKDLEVSVNGSNVPRPVTKFSQINFHYDLAQEIKHVGYQSPTAIQAQAIPIVMSGRDVIGLAKTGSGKTLAFVWWVIEIYLPAFASLLLLPFTYILLPLTYGLWPITYDL